MLTEDEKDFLARIPDDKIVKVMSLDPHTNDVAEDIIASIRAEYPDVKAVHMGATGLGISGQGDVDIYVLANRGKFSSFLPGLVDLFGKPTKEKPDSITWEFLEDGFQVTVYLANANSEAMRRQLVVFNTLKSNPVLLQEYAVLKESMSGKSYREYQRVKYEFYHRILEK